MQTSPTEFPIHNIDHIFNLKANEADFAASYQLRVVVTYALLLLLSDIEMFEI